MIALFFCKTVKSLDLRKAWCQAGIPHKLASTAPYKLTDGRGMDAFETLFEVCVVREPPNGKFARIGDIIDAEEAAHNPPKRRRCPRRSSCKVRSLHN